jgi:glycosyltransferase involved in cell wall biosynthesis
MVISARMDAAARDAVASGRWPRKDFFELQRALNADVIDYGIVEGTWFWRVLKRLLGMWITQVVITFLRHRRYRHIFTDGEHTGVPLAILLYLSPHWVRHVTIGHTLSSPVRRTVVRLLRPHRHLHSVLFHASPQIEFARTQLGLRPEQTVLVPYQVDPAFWQVTKAQHSLGQRKDGEQKPLVVSAGLECRDYSTLFRAVENLPVAVHIAAGSLWSGEHYSASTERPANVTVQSLDYQGLRELYSRANIVVVPLREIDRQAGITVILEAMAMGKALVVTATRGQRDVVRGRLCTADGPRGEPIGGPSPFGVAGELAEAETGLYVPPADPAALRAAIQYLLDHPDEAARMGANGRRLVEQHMNLDQFTARVAAIVRGEPLPSAHGMQNAKPTVSAATREDAGEREETAPRTPTSDADERTPTAMVDTAGQPAMREAPASDSERPLSLRRREQQEVRSDA